MLNPFLHSATPRKRAFWKQVCSEDEESGQFRVSVPLYNSLYPFTSYVYELCSTMEDYQTVGLELYIV